MMRNILIDLWSWIWWKWIPGQNIRIAWPANKPFAPWETYGPWLEKHVGRQHWHWDWKFYGHMEGGRYGSREVYDEVEIRIRRDRQHLATYILLLWDTQTSLPE